MHLHLILTFLISLLGFVSALPPAVPLVNRGVDPRACIPCKCDGFFGSCKCRKFGCCCVITLPDLHKPDWFWRPPPGVANANATVEATTAEE